LGGRRGKRWIKGREKYWFDDRESRKGTEKKSPSSNGMGEFSPKALWLSRIQKVVRSVTKRRKNMGNAGKRRRTPLSGDLKGYENKGARNREE